MQLLGREQVGLVENQHHGDAIGLGRGQETVDEGSGGLRIIDGDDKKHLVYIGRQDMALLREIRRFADDVVAAVFNLGDEDSTRRALLGCRRNGPVRRWRKRQTDAVTHSHRIGAADALQPEFSFDLAVDGIAVVGKDGIPRPCVFYDKTFHYTVMISLFLAASKSSIFLMNLS